MRKLILITFSLLIVTNLFAEDKPVTMLKDGVVWTRIKTSELTRKLEAGERVYQIIDEQAIPIQRLKAKDYIPPADTKPLQVTEDNKDGNTDYVIINSITKEQIK